LNVKTKLEYTKVFRSADAPLIKFSYSNGKSLKSMETIGIWWIRRRSEMRPLVSALGFVVG